MGNTSWNSLALNTQGLPRIAYHLVGSNQLRYARRDTSGWTHEIIDNDGWAGDYVSLALGSNDVAVVSYHREVSAYDLRFAFRDATGWVRGTLDGGSQNTGWYTSLALDRFGYPYIAYHNHSNESLNFMWYENGQSPLFSGVTVTPTRTPTQTSTRTSTPSKTPSPTALPGVTPTPSETVDAWYRRLYLPLVLWRDH